jgi:hypothetical protein
MEYFMKKNNRLETKKPNKTYFGFTRKEIILSIIIPMLSVYLPGIFLIHSVNKTNETQVRTAIQTNHTQIESAMKTAEAQIESAIKTAEAQVKAAEISKINKIEYDYKEINNWDVTESKSYMPLSLGNYWIYRGYYKAYSTKFKEYFTKNVELEIRVKEVINNEDKGISLYILGNYIENAFSTIDEEFEKLSYEELISPNPLKIKDNECALLLVANKLFYIPYDEINIVKEFVNDPDKIINGHGINTPNLNFDNLIFEFPLFKGQRFGDFKTITRGDLSHFWYVNEQRNIQILNGTTFETVPVFYLTYNTLPDYQVIQFRPYVGILSYTSIHNGSTKDLEINLIEYEIN